MPTSSYMPSVTVEIAFNAGYLTPAASRVWTDVSDYVELAEGITINHGRQDERSTADANTLTLTLDNRDGRFTAGRSASPYYPNVKIYRPIRVTADPVDGLPLVRFTGYINAWPVEWDGTDAYAKATITASSRLARLGLVRQFQSLITESILADDPVAYYPLGEPEGATQAADASGMAAPPLMLYGDPELPVVFGSATGPGTDGITAATFAGGQTLVATHTVPAGTAIGIEAFFNSTTPASQIASVNPVALVITGTGAVRAFLSPGFVVDSPTSYADGLTHHAFAEWDGNFLRLYVDGVLIGTTAAVGAMFGFPLVSVGGEPIGTPFTGTVAHAAFYNTATSAARIAEHAGAGLTGFAGEDTIERFTRYAVMGGVPTAEISGPSFGATTMSHIDTTDQQVVELLRVVEGTEAGVMYDERDGTLVLVGRGSRYVKTTLFTLDISEGEVEADYNPVVDGSTVLNDVSVRTSDGKVSARFRDAASESDYGVATVSAETATEDPNEPLNLASWAVYSYKEPRTRVPTLTVDVLAQVGKTPNSRKVLEANVGDVISVTNHPTQAAASTATYFVEGYTETYGQELCRMTFNLSPRFPYDAVLEIDNIVTGAIDTYAVGL